MSFKIVLLIKRRTTLRILKAGCSAFQCRLYWTSIFY